jgi:hypothetical protein
MLPKVINVIALSNYTIRLRFESGEDRIFDVSSFLDRGIFSELKDTELFKKARVSFNTVEWPNGADLDPEMLYEDSRPFQVYGNPDSQAEQLFVHEPGDSPLSSENLYKEKKE